MIEQMSVNAGINYLKNIDACNGHNREISPVFVLIDSCPDILQTVVGVVDRCIVTVCQSPDVFFSQTVVVADVVE